MGQGIIELCFFAALRRTKNVHFTPRCSQFQAVTSSILHRASLIHLGRKEPFQFAIVGISIVVGECALYIKLWFNDPRSGKHRILHSQARLGGRLEYNNQNAIGFTLENLNKIYLAKKIISKIIQRREMKNKNVQIWWLLFQSTLSTIARPNDNILAT